MPPLAPTPIAPPNVAPGSTISTINDAVTGNSYSRDTSVPGSTYQLVPKAPAAPAAPATPAAPPGGSPDSSASVLDQVAASLGYKSYADAVGTLTAAPTESESQLYNDAYSAAGLDDLNGKILSRQNDLATAQNHINDNPWLDESDRVGRARTVNDLATADIKNLQDNYSTKLKSVEDLVTRESNDNNATTASNKAKLAALEAQAKQAASDQAAATKAAATSAKNANAAPKTIKSASGATYQWNPDTQTFDQIFAGKATSTASPKVSTADAISSMDSELSSVTGQDGYIDPQNWATGLSAWQAQGLPASSYISNFKKYANTADSTNNYTGLTKPK